MAHFAKIENGIVTRVIVADQEYIDSYIDTTPGKWVQTSYNTHGGIYYTPHTATPDADQSKALRKNYAAVGYTYDEQRDAFISPKPFASWVLNEQSCTWEPPIPKPSGDIDHSWDEDNLEWKPEP